MMKQIYRYILTITLAIVTIFPIYAYWDGVDNESIGPMTKSGSTYYVLYNQSGEFSTIDSREYTLSGPGAQLSFQAYRTFAGLGNLKVDNYVNNSYSNIFDKNVNASNYSPYSANVNVDATKIKFYTSVGATLKKHFRYVNVTMASYCAPKETKVDFGSNTYLNDQTAKLKIFWSNTAAKTVTITNNTGQFSIDKTQIPAKAGYYGNTIITITYKRTAVGTHTETLTVNGQKVTITGTTTQAPTAAIICPSATAINTNQPIRNSSLSNWRVVRTDNINTVVSGTFTWENGNLLADCNKTYTVNFTPDDNGYKTTTCAIPVPVNPIPQTITWTQSGLNVGDLLLNGSTSGHDATVYYTSSDPTVATIDGTTLRMVKPGYVTVTAYADATCNYLVAEPVSRDFELSRTRPTVTPNTVNLTYGQALQEVEPTCTATYNGETVEGTFTWVNGAFQPEVGTSTQKAIFTPADESRFSAIEVDVTVIVGKAQSIISCNINLTVREGNSYTQPFSSTNRQTPISISSSDVSLAKYENGKLTFGTITNSNTVTLTVSQAGNENYYAATTKKFTFTILKKSDVCLPINPLTEDLYNQCFMEGSGSVYWCSTPGEQHEKVLGFDAYHERYLGIAFGSIMGGFDYNYDTLVIAFKGVPDRISFDIIDQGVQVSVWSLTKGWHRQNNNITLLDWKIEEFDEKNNRWNTKWTYNKTSVDGLTVKNTCNTTLTPDTRMMRIVRRGNFAGYIQNLVITRKHYLNTGSINTFGITNTYPLQKPQVVNINYSSIGDCGSTDQYIVVESSNQNVFYTDADTIWANVGFDQYYSYPLVIRCKDVNQTGKIILKSSDGLQAELNVNSVAAEINTSNYNTLATFLTGTEQNQHSETDKYRGLSTISFSQCFAGSTPLFDTLYIFGVTGNTEPTAATRFDYFDPILQYNLPKVNVADDETACNAHTPLFVYYKDGNKYSYKRTISNAAQEGLQDIDAGNKKIAILGYCPYAYTGTDNTYNGFMQFNGNGSQTTEITLINTEIISKNHTADGRATDYATNQITLGRGDNSIGGTSAVLVFQSASKTEPYTVRIHSLGTNTLTAAAGLPISKLKASVQGITINGSATTQPSPAIAIKASNSDTKLNLVIDDKLNGTRQAGSSLDLVPSDGIGSIGLGNSNSQLTLDGGVVTLHNGKGQNPLAAAYQFTTLEKDGQVAVAYGIGADKTDNEILISDGTVLGEETLNLPLHTIISGGTFNSGDVVCYEDLALPSLRPTDREGKTVNREYKQLTDIPASYNIESVLPDGSGKIYPMLPTTEDRKQRVKQWVAATPDRQDEAVAEINKNLLYSEITPAQQKYENKPTAYQPITNTADFDIDGEVSMLMQLDSADSWRMFVAPFDITGVYVLELDDEAKWEKKSREEALAMQQAVTKQFNDYLASYIDIDKPTSLPLLAVINKFMQGNSGAKIYNLTAYNGKNVRYADYYLYQVDSESENEVWHFSGEELDAKWKIAEQDGGIIMRQGKTYAIEFPYCTSCDNFHGYDYWTDKYILLQGKGKQTIIGAASAIEQMNDAYNTSSSDAVLAGNASFQSVTTSNRVFTFNSKTDYYTAQDAGTTIRPTESALFTTITNSRGGRVLSIARNGATIFEEQAPENPEEIEEPIEEDPQITTAWQNLIGESGWTAIGANGSMIITSLTSDRVSIFTTAGQTISTATLHSNSQIQILLPAGVYIVRGEKQTQKVVVR